MHYHNNLYHIITILVLNVYAQKAFTLYIFHNSTSGGVGVDAYEFIGDGQWLQCDQENREHLNYGSNIISDQTHATNLLAKPQSVFRYSAKSVWALGIFQYNWLILSYSSRQLWDY